MVTFDTVLIMAECFLCFDSCNEFTLKVTFTQGIIEKCCISEQNIFFIQQCSITAMSTFHLCFNLTSSWCAQGGVFLQWSYIFCNNTPQTQQDSQQPAQENTRATAAVWEKRICVKLDTSDGFSYSEIDLKQIYILCIPTYFCQWHVLFSVRAGNLIWHKAQLKLRSHLQQTTRAHIKQPSLKLILCVILMLRTFLQTSCNWLYSKTKAFVWWLTNLTSKGHWDPSSLSDISSDLRA